jgi:hypothetical protein
MTREQLAGKLAHLDPGATFSVEADVLARMFGTDPNSDELLQAAEAFAMEHRCAFAAQKNEHTVLCFEKNDIY